MTVIHTRPIDRQMHRAASPYRDVGLTILYHVHVRLARGGGGPHPCRHNWKHLDELALLTTGGSHRVLQKLPPSP